MAVIRFSDQTSKVCASVCGCETVYVLERDYVCNSPGYMFHSRNDIILLFCVCR